MSTDATPRIIPQSPHPRRDEKEPPPLRDGLGRVIADDADWAERVARLTRQLEELDQLPDTDPPDLDAEIMRSIDEGRPHRPLFRGLY